MLGTSVVSVCHDPDAPLPGSLSGSICRLYPDGVGARAVVSNVLGSTAKLDVVCMSPTPECGDLPGWD